MNDFFRTKNFKVFVIILAVVCVISVLSATDNSLFSGLINASTKGLSQVTAAAAASLDTADYDELLAENEKLRSENAELRSQLVDYYDLQKENERLWNYYDIKKENPSYTIIPSNVIKRDTNDDFYSFTLDVGTNLGVSVNDPVITENGLVGWVYKADLATCKVKTILSPDTKAGAVDKVTGDSGVISGSTELCDDNLTAFTKIAADNTIKKGDIIVTSGTGGVYPGNLIIGEAQEIKYNEYDTTMYAVVKPYEDIKSITAAAVITGFDGKGEIKR